MKEGKYALASLDGKPVAGILQPGKRDVNVSQWVTYFSVDDVDAAAKAGKEAGAKVVVPPRDIANQGRAALLVDPQGAPVAVARLAGGDPAPAPPPLNGWLWVDLWTPDPAASSAFYRGLLGLEPETVDVGGTPYTVLGRGDKAYAGMIRIPQPEIRPNWLPIVRVEDARVTAERAAQLGGRVLLAPRPEVRDGKAAIVADPTGGAVAVHVVGRDAGPRVVRPAGGPAMRSHGDGARRRRAWALAALVAAASLLPACDGGTVSVGVGVAVPAPWGTVTVPRRAVPFGPHYGGRYGPMW